MTGSDEYQQNRFRNIRTKSNITIHQKRSIKSEQYNDMLQIQISYKTVGKFQRITAFSVVITQKKLELYTNDKIILDIEQVEGMVRIIDRLNS